MKAQYTPSQLRSAVGITKDAFRHWKAALPPFGGGSGHGPKFTAGDLLAVLVVWLKNKDFAIHLSPISTFAQPLFETCSSAPWTALERSSLVVYLPAGQLSFIRESGHNQCRIPLVVVPLRAPVLSLRAALLTEHDLATQESLLFPPSPATLSPSGRAMEMPA